MTKREKYAGTLAGVSALVCAVPLLTHAPAIALGWLTAAITITAVPAGALAILMMTYLVRGPWTNGLHRPLTSAALTMPFAAVIFVPVLLWLRTIYPWVAVPMGDAGSFKAVWLSPAFFVGRSLGYFAAWTALALWVRASWGRPRRMMVSASAGLVIYALTASLAGVDWLESLTPEFHSSLYGFIVLTFQLLAGFAFALLMALRRPNAAAETYGPILLAAVMLWAYNHAMQYIIIWAGNVPEEVAWYTHRAQGLWGAWFWFLIGAQFVIPFFMLLSGHIRNGRRALLVLAAITLSMRFVEAFLLTMPERGQALEMLWLAAAGAMVLAGALWWIGYGVASRLVVGSRRDLMNLKEDMFDAAGNPRLRRS
jgi:hypothetical protein